MIALAGVTKSFAPDLAALGPIDLQVDTGELVAIVGPSGCGKTTLLRIIAGLEPASAGTASAGTGSIGYVFQDPTLLPWRTVQRNVELLGEMHGLDAGQRRRAAAAALATVGLTSSAGLYPRALSGGMRMRVSLARALTLQPRVFLFDEPFGALDELTRERLNEEIGALFAASPFAGVFVTHSVSEAVFLGTRVAVMSARPGRLVLDRPVPFPHPRPPELRFDPTFVDLCASVSVALRAAS